MSQLPGNAISIFSNSTKTVNQRHESRPQNKSDSSIVISGSKTGPNVVGLPRKVTVARSSSLNRCRSVASLSVRQTTPRPITSNEKTARSQNETPGPGDKNAISHFCTPRRSKSNNNRSASRPTPAMSPFDANHSGIPPATPDYFSRVQFETPANKTLGLADDLQSGEESSNLTVGVRVRPLSAREAADPTATSVVMTDGNQVSVASDNGTTHSFAYDYCFSSCNPLNPDYANQDAVFSAMVHPMVDSAFKGYNACLLAYGQTGSGKSYSMMGTDIDTGSCVGREAGIIPRFCFELFERIDALDPEAASVTVEISYFEIYNEKIHDLLGGNGEGGKRPPLKVREHPVLGPYVVDLSQHGVASYHDLRGWLTLGNGQRATAATGMNDKSSRSHAIFSIVLTRTQEDGITCRSRINLVDLAGSERLAQTCVSGERLKEAVSINCSLLTLKKVMVSLSENAGNRRRGFVPYRDSVLTWLLRESLGGNSRTAMLATVSPTGRHLEETLATLRYACQARSIVNRVRKNENPNDRLIRELREEVERLRSVRQDYEQKQSLTPRRNPATETAAELDTLRDQLKAAEDNLVTAQKTWSERLEEAESCKTDAMQRLRQTGVAVHLEWDCTQPCLVNLAADPMLSGTLFYLLPPGVVRIGCPSGDYKPDIALSGPLIYQLHCSIENSDGRLSLRAGRRGETFVNGCLAESGCTVPLGHGDRVVVGGNHMFRVSNPPPGAAVAAAGGQQPPVADYEFAQQEVCRVQEERLQRQLEAAKLAALQQLEGAKREAEQRLDKQKAQYEERIGQLGSDLTREKEALLEAQKATEELSLQMQSLCAQHQRITSSDGDGEAPISPYRSTFLQDLDDIFNESVHEIQTPSNQDNTVSLYHMDKLLQEATRLCKDHAMNYVFSQQQVLQGGRLEARVLVRDVGSCRSALWSRARLSRWLETLREWDERDERGSVRRLLEGDDSWQEDEGGEGEGWDNDRSISVNTAAVTRQFNDSFNAISSSLLNDSVSHLSDSTVALDSSNRLSSRNDSSNRLLSHNDSSNHLSSCNDSSNHLSSRNDISNRLLSRNDSSNRLLSRNNSSNHLLSHNDSSNRLSSHDSNRLSYNDITNCLSFNESSNRLSHNDSSKDSSNRLSYNDSSNRLSSCNESGNHLLSYNDSSNRSSHNDSTLVHVDSGHGNVDNSCASRSTYVFTQDELHCVILDIEERLHDLGDLCRAESRSSEVGRALDVTRQSVDSLRRALDLPPACPPPPPAPSASPLKSNLRVATPASQARPRKAVRFELRD